MQPISASTRAPSWTPRPGKLKMALASGCWRKDSSAASASWSAARHAASNWRRRAKACLPSASSISSGWLAQSPRKNSRSRSASASMPRLRPARLRADRSWARVSRAAWLGVGASLSSSRALGAAQLVGPSGEGVQGGGVVLAQQRAELVGDLYRFQVASCWARARTAIARARSVSAGSCRCMGISVRRMLASTERRRGRTSCGRRRGSRGNGQRPLSSRCSPWPTPASRSAAPNWHEPSPRPSPWAFSSPTSWASPWASSGPVRSPRSPPEGGCASRSAGERQPPAARCAGSGSPFPCSSRPSLSTVHASTRPSAASLPHWSAPS